MERTREADSKPENDLEEIQRLKVRQLDEKPESDQTAIAKLKEAMHLQLMNEVEKEALLLETIGEDDEERF